MKRKLIIFIFVLILFGLAYFYFKHVYGWMEFQKNSDTPKEFISHVIIKKEDYSKDSTILLKRLRSLLNNHEQSFYIKDYFDSTQLIIDSIIYSANFDKLAVFVITQNPTYKQSDPNKNFEWYYDGYCYLGVRENDTIDLNWIDGGYSNDYNEQELSNSLREFYFRMFAGIKDTSGVVSKYKYNLNDRRFWNSRIWKDIEEKKIKKKEFEEEKKQHPENVYEPKK